MIILGEERHNLQIRPFDASEDFKSKRSAQFFAFQPSYVEGYFGDVCVEWGVKTTPRGISASRLARNKIPTATPMFLGSNFSIGRSVALPDVTRSQKSKMAAEIM